MGGNPRAMAADRPVWIRAKRLPVALVVHWRSGGAVLLWRSGEAAQRRSGGGAAAQWWRSGAVVHWRRGCCEPWSTFLTYGIEPRSLIVATPMVAEDLGDSITTGPDGRVAIMVCSNDPGVANWIDPGGHDHRVMRLSFMMPHYFPIQNSSCHGQ